MADDIRVGIIGFGLAGSVFHAPLIASTPGLRLAAIVTKDPDKIASAQQLYPGIAAFDSADELLAAGAIDIAVIATPNVFHMPISKQAIEAGVGVVVDKPIAINSTEAQEVVDLAKELGVLLTVFQNRRWDGDFLTVKSLIERGELGRVARFESRFERWRPTPKGGWRETVSPAEGGGLLFDLGAHIIDQAVSLFGPVKQLYAEIDRTRPHVTTDDDVFLALTHDNGVRTHLYASAVAADLGPRFRVLGTTAAYTSYGLDVQEAALREGQVPGDGWGAYPETAFGYLSGRSDSRVPVPTEPGNYPEFYRLLVSAARGEGPVPVDPQDAVYTLRVIEAARNAYEDASRQTVLRDNG